ncbi:Inner membrane transport protein YdhC [Marinomonas spartinae]|uniref:MFS transporter n=1 Tax=Marinomonas spartinae TaxID=1792290 RepID=UPI000809121F|nr:MFS transporter [Marinomonas spartinae]SBS31616.1 Inner membrane transport protein YdhC [Marinomonas spartinae]
MLLSNYFSFGVGMMLKSITYNNQVFTIYLILISFFGMMNTDIFLPCVNLMSVDLGVSTGDLQYIFLSYFLGVGISQFFCGSISDCNGRRSITLSALFLTSVGSILCSFSTSLEVLILGRFFLGLGAGVLIFIWRAIAYDVLDKENAFHMIANVSPAIVLSPAISPVLGGFILHVSNWHFVFAFVSAFSIFLFLITFFFLPETIDEKTHGFSIFMVFGSAKKLLLSNKFLIMSLGLCVVYAGYFLYIVQSPFIFHELGYTSFDVSLFYIPVAVSYFLGSRITKVFLHKVHKKMLIFFGAFLFFLGGGCLIVFCSSEKVNSAYFFISAFCLLAIGNGITLTVGSAEVMSIFSKSLNASVSSLLGFMQSLSTVLIVYFISSLNDNFSYESGLLFLYIACVLAVLGWVLIVRFKYVFDK